MNSTHVTHSSKIFSTLLFVYGDLSYTHMVVTGNIAIENPVIAITLHYANFSNTNGYVFYPPYQYNLSTIPFLDYYFALNLALSATSHQFTDTKLNEMKK